MALAVAHFNNERRERGRDEGKKAPLGGAGSDFLRAGNERETSERTRYSFRAAAANAKGQETRTSSASRNRFRSEIARQFQIDCDFNRSMKTLEFPRDWLLTTSFRGVGKKSLEDGPRELGRRLTKR